MVGLIQRGLCSLANLTREHCTPYWLGHGELPVARNSDLYRAELAGCSNAAGYLNGSVRQKHNQESDPASNNTDCRVRTDEHEGQKLKLPRKHQPMYQRAIHHKWDRYDDVQRSEAVQQEHSWL